MSKYVIAIVAAAGLAGAAFGQVRPTSATYGFRLVPQGAAAGLTNGGSTTLTSITFVLQAQATTAAGTTNYGIHRMSSGTITGSSATLVRGTSNGSNFGRFRGPGLVNNFGAQAAAAGSNTASGNAVATDLASNVNGRFAADARSIAQIDAWRGAQTSSSDINGDPVDNPFAASMVSDGSASAWASLYSITVSADSGATSAGLSATAFLNIAAFFADVGGNWTSDLLAAPTQVATSFNWTIVPTPGAAALLGLGGLAAARRRR